ncbi:thiol-disulfide oxidoreductase DCC family protein [Pseudoponticoccus marisrubri]|uniref:Thiol-disulfide oxidoreductase n=1 Tax=Pseudoponticoccus marisrubri TaxID=1685382 RepID=A0A0W7WIV0_9RHOB|nr:DCC1-like thiol-disulfide oxidoreductase family protein [Pseudoponticoccus marisrubri]KUF10509.1 thiol-disulfide oxidoreductase [Pseudoponticoccus marisrubri]
MRIGQTTPFSWQQDPAVPEFDDARMLVIMDGDCALCSATARRIARLDRRDEVRIATIQSDLGRALATHLGLDPDDPDTWILLSDGRAFGGFDAVLRLFPRLSRRWQSLRLLSVVPAPLRDALYARIARNRYRLWGRADMCALPDPELRRRLIG